jgi:dihydroorotate dehydrogenase (NAD+) catalytic subunit
MEEDAFLTMGDHMPVRWPRYDLDKTYTWNYDHAPDPLTIDVDAVPGKWDFLGLPVGSPLGVPAGPLLNGRWVVYYASLGFDVLTYKTVRSVERACYPMPNLQPVRCEQLAGREDSVPAAADMQGSWAVSFGMPSKAPDAWRADVDATRRRLPKGKVLSVSVVGTVQDGWTIDDVAEDYARCARWAVESGADSVETNFSCPNVSTCDGQLYQDFHDARHVAQRVREAIPGVPYIIKIGRLTRTEQVEALLDAVGGAADALAMTNSIATKVTAPDGSALFDGQRRGICGDATRRASIDQTQLFARLVRERSLPLRLIGVGGASTADHVRAYLSAGAHAVHLATAAMVNPAVAVEIRRSWAEAPSRP